MSATHTPVTMAQTYSRALDEQARLVALMNHPNYRSSMLDAVVNAHGPDPGRAIYEMTRASVEQSEAGYVARSVCSLLEQTSRDIPDVGLAPEQLLAPSGFLWLQTPLALPPHGIDDLPPFGAALALSWHTYRADDAHQNGGIFVTVWVEWPGTSTHCAPVNALTWGFYEPWSAAVSRRKTPGERDIATLVARWLAALNAFCDQRLVTGRRVPAERATRRRMERAGRESSDVLVVELRRADQRHSEPAEGGREWSCSWSVSGHWRRQWYESRQAHQAIWISPYIKGDPEKPLRDRRRVFAIVH